MVSLKNVNKHETCQSIRLFVLYKFITIFAKILEHIENNACVLDEKRLLEKN